MKKPWKLTALMLLAIALPLLLTACGEKEKAGGGRIVYVPEKVAIELPMKTVESACMVGDMLYLLGSEKTQGGEGRCTIARVPLSGGTAEVLPNYTPHTFPEDSEYSVLSSWLRYGEDNKLWITERVYIQTFDLPDGFDPTTQSKFQYLDGAKTVWVLRQVDMDGRELFCIEDASLEEVLADEFIIDLWIGQDGERLAATQRGVAVLDQNGNLKNMLDGVISGRFIALKDGRIGIRCISQDAPGEFSTALRIVDQKIGAWGEAYPLPQGVERIFPGDSNALFYYLNGDILYAWQEDSGGAKRLLSWMDSGINADELVSFSALSGDKLMALTARQGSTFFVELSALTASSESVDVPEKTVLTYATAGLSPTMRAKIADFNQKNDTYYISVRDYSEYIANGWDTSPVQTLLSTEIIAGNVPDIIDEKCLHPRMVHLGVLEDLWPYIEKDPELGRDGVMAHALECAEVDGHLYSIADSFSIYTMAGSQSIVGDHLTWTMADARTAMQAMPDGSRMFGKLDTKSAMLQDLMYLEAERFVDWRSGTSCFDSPEFREILSYCNTLPSDYPVGEYNPDWEQRLRTLDGEQLALPWRLESFNHLQELEAYFQGPYSFVGYPGEDGNVGSRFSLKGKLCMSRTCTDKEGAWLFMREILLPKFADLDESVRYTDVRALEGQDYYFPINKADFIWMAEQLMEPVYWSDENGKQSELAARGITYTDAIEFWYYALPAELYDQFMELYEVANREWSCNQHLLDIITEQAGAYFAGDRSLDDTVAAIQSRVGLYLAELQ